MFSFDRFEDVLFLLVFGRQAFISMYTPVFLFLPKIYSSTEQTEANVPSAVFQSALGLE